MTVDDFGTPHAPNLSCARDEILRISPGFAGSRDLWPFARAAARPGVELC
jgi:hypothetical protein